MVGAIGGHQAITCANFGQQLYHHTVPFHYDKLLFDC